MATYEKIDDNNFVEVTEVRRPLTKQDLIQRRDELKARYDALVQPTNAELIELGKLLHPYYIERDQLLVEWQELKDLINYLQNL